MTKFKVAGYVKLAKLWEKNKDKAIIYHREYYVNKFFESSSFELVDVYIDITGKKETFNRQEMVRLLSDIELQKVNCIFTQTKGYLAANPQEFCYLIKLMFEFNPDLHIVTEDKEYNINTFRNEDSQKEELLNLSNHYASLNPKGYETWKQKIMKTISKIRNNE